MKKIVYEAKNFEESSIRIKEGQFPLPETTVFYIIGLTFTPEKNKSREEIENEGLKSYTGDFRTPFIADSEEVFLHHFFRRDYQKNIDLLHILTLKDVESLKKCEVNENLCSGKSFLSNLFMKKTDCLIFVKEDALKERLYVSLTYTDESDKEKYILDMSKKGWMAYLCESEKNVNNMFEEMNEAIKGSERFYPSFYASNPALWVHEKIDLKDHLSPEEIEELQNDIEYQKELKETEIENKKYRERKEKNESYDTNKAITYQRLTGFKYI